MAGLRWVLTGILLGVGIFVLVANAALLWRWLITRKKVPSGIPLVGGVCCAAAMMLAPADGARAWAWVPIVIDPAGIVAFLVSVTCQAHGNQGQSKHEGRSWIAMFVATIALQLVGLACALWLFDLFGHSLACRFAQSLWDPVERQCYTPEPNSAGTPKAHP